MYAAALESDIKSPDMGLKKGTYGTSEAPRRRQKGRRPTARSHRKSADPEPT